MFGCSVQAHLDEVDATLAHFEEANLTDASFERATLQYSKFTDATLQNASFREADLQGAVLAGAELLGADLKGADMRGANMYKTTLAHNNGERTVLIAELATWDMLPEIGVHAEIYSPLQEDVEVLAHSCKDDPWVQAKHDRDVRVMIDSLRAASCVCRAWCAHASGVR